MEYSAELERLAGAMGYPAGELLRAVPRMDWGGSLQEIGAALGLGKAEALTFVEALPERQAWRAKCEARRQVEAERQAALDAAEAAIRARAEALQVGEWLELDVPHLITAEIKGAVKRLRLQPYNLTRAYPMGRSQVWGRVELARVLSESA